VAKTQNDILTASFLSMGGFQGFSGLLRGAFGARLCPLLGCLLRIPFPNSFQTENQTRAACVVSRVRRDMRRILKPNKEDPKTCVGHETWSVHLGDMRWWQNLWVWIGWLAFQPRSHARWLAFQPRSHACCVPKTVAWHSRHNQDKKR
jgi:hypothetical protein